VPAEAQTLPAGHDVQEALPFEEAKLPGEQGMHRALPAGEKEPGGHGWHCPPPGSNDPAEHPGDGVHRPRVQNPDAQTFPQAPQLLGSVGRSTQLPPQLVKPSLQTNPQQLPPSQLGFAAAKQTSVALLGASSQSLSHWPQNSKSVAKAWGRGGRGRRL